jgi:hypothetical protein
MASASLMYSPRLVLPYHCWSGRKYFPNNGTSPKIRFEMRIQIVAPFLVDVAVTDENFVSRHYPCAWYLLLTVSGSLKKLISIPNPLQMPSSAFRSILEENLLTAAVIEFRGSAVGMTGYSLVGFQGAVIFQKIRNPGRPK